MGGWAWGWSWGSLLVRVGGWGLILMCGMVLLVQLFSRGGKEEGVEGIFRISLSASTMFFVLERNRNEAERRLTVYVLLVALA